jgi:hypothetical protein
VAIAGSVSCRSVPQHGDDTAECARVAIRDPMSTRLAMQAFSTPRGGRRGVCFPKPPGAGRKGALVGGLGLGGGGLSQVAVDARACQAIAPGQL